MVFDDSKSDPSALVLFIPPVFYVFESLSNSALIVFTVFFKPYEDLCLVGLFSGIFILFYLVLIVWPIFSLISAISSQYSLSSEPFFSIFYSFEALSFDSYFFLLTSKFF